MKVSELIERLKEVPNQNARVDILIPEEIEGEWGATTRDFYVSDYHAYNENEDDEEYIELYSLTDLKGNKNPEFEK